MPALRKTDFSASITFLGVNHARAAGLSNAAVDAAIAGFGGFQGESRGGLTRPSCSRVIDLYPRGTEISNTRQISILSGEELAEIARIMGVAALPPTLLSANILIKGIPDFSHVPPGARLLAESGTCLVLDVQNWPCHLPAKEIEVALPGKGGLFKQAARGLRGVTAWVERPGRLVLGERLTLFVPDQRGWQP